MFSPLNSFTTFQKTQYIQRGNYSNVCIFEIASLVSFPGYKLRKYGIYFGYCAVYSMVFASKQIYNATRSKK